ncbi:MAG: OmpA family protein [Bacteroidales bacterium]
MLKGLLVLMLTFSFSILCAQEQPPQKVGPWDLVSGFSISQDENYMVISLMVLGKKQLFETKLENGLWSEPKPINTINKHFGEGFDVSGPALNYNGQLLFFHADFSNTLGGYDIYYSKRSSDGWSAPIHLDATINTPENEMHPSISPGLERIFFARSAPNPDFKKPRGTPECQKLFSAYKNPDGSWGAPLPMHDLINKGCEKSISVAIDGKTILFSSVDEENHKEGYNIYFTREIMEDSWLQPTVLESAASDGTNIAPQIAGNNLYFLRKTSERRQDYSRIYKVELPNQATPLKTFTSKGNIFIQDTKKPINASLTVFDPTTLKELGYYESNAETGAYELPLLDGKNYIVDVRNSNYSFASFMVDLRGNDKKLGPELIELFDEINLQLTVYDSETIRPLEAEVKVQDASDSNITYKGEMITEGLYSISLPIGSKYIVEGRSNGFESNQFDFELQGDVIFSRFERNMDLKPVRKPFEITVSDSETEEGLAAEVLITNLSRDEVIIFSAEDVKDGKVSAMLREGDEYEFTVRGAQGYSFYNQVVDLKEEGSGELKAELVSLKAKTSIRLNNINFDTNSAELSSESFPELNRVVELIFDNPDITLEISAHTDNVGNAGFNMLLSERRAQSVVNYLLEHGVPHDQIVAKGYGLTQPMVPNTSDENRALNRRVEFKILDVEDKQDEENLSS